MPRVEIPVTQIVQAGATPPTQITSDSVNGHEFYGNDGRVFLEVTNVGGTAENVTLVTPGTVGGLDIADLVVSVPPTSTVRVIGPLPPTIFNQPGTSTVQVNAVTNYMRYRAYRL